VFAPGEVEWRFSRETRLSCRHPRRKQWLREPSEYPPRYCTHDASTTDTCNSNAWSFIDDKNDYPIYNWGLPNKVR